MRKSIMIIIMVLICGMYFYSVRAGFKEKNEEEKVVVEEVLQEQKIKLTTTYPTTIEELLQINNQLLKLQYSKDMTKEVAPLAVETMRLMYASELSALNNQVVQETLFVEELERNVEKKMYIISSEIKSIDYKEKNATVIYYTTSGDIQRDYKLIQEAGKWKLYSWKDTALPVSRDKVEEKNESH